MGARPSSFRKSGGGFLNNVDATITNYQFTDEFNGNPFTAGKNAQGKEKFHSLYVALSARVDGAEEDVTTTLFAGGFDDFDVSEDGFTLTSDEDKQLGGGTAFAKLIQSLVEAGFDENLLPEDEINYQAIIGTRVRFTQQKDEAGTAKLGKRVDKKTGKSYDRQDLVITNVYSLPDAKPAKGGKVTKPAAGKAGKAPAGVDVAELATQTLIDILSAAKGKTIPKAKISMAVLRLLAKHPNREEVRGLLNNDAFLSDNELWKFENDVITLA